MIDLGGDVSPKCGEDVSTKIAENYTSFCYFRLFLTIFGHVDSGSSLSGRGLITIDNYQIQDTQSVPFNFSSIVETIPRQEVFILPFSANNCLIKIGSKPVVLAFCTKFVLDLHTNCFNKN